MRARAKTLLAPNVSVHKQKEARLQQGWRRCDTVSSESSLLTRGNRLFAFFLLESTTSGSHDWGIRTTERTEIPRRERRCLTFAAALDAGDTLRNLPISCQQRTTRIPSLTAQSTPRTAPPDGKKINNKNKINGLTSVQCSYNV